MEWEVEPTKMKGPEKPTNVQNIGIYIIKYVFLFTEV